MIAIPQTGIGSMHHVEENFNIDETIVWSCPIDDIGVQHELTLGITKADFERSMLRDVMRYGTILDDSFAARFSCISIGIENGLDLATWFSNMINGGRL